MEPSTTTGRKGSLANPEVREDVPGHVIPIIRREFDDFDNEAEKYLDGQTPENEFIGFRLKQGVYGQRQADVQMIRVKLPMGGITPEQMEMFADGVEKLFLEFVNNFSFSRTGPIDSISSRSSLEARSDILEKNRR